MPVCISMAVIAQTPQTPHKSKLSPFVRHALTESLRQPSVTRGSQPPTAPRHILAFVKAHNAQSLLQQYGCKTYAQWGDIHIARIPLTSLAALSAEAQVERIEARASARQLLDTSTTIINALPIYEATPAHQAFTGDGVVMGVMDVGFDLTHPNFYNRDLTHTRISALWDQLSPDTIGSTFPVGREYIGPDAILAHAHSTDGLVQLHGTHTLGIATGTGYDTPYRGLAFDSDICLVSNIVEEDSDYFDIDEYLQTSALDALGFKYLFDYADRQGKPCVASFSEGYYPMFDEDDSLLAAVLDSLSGPGRIIVASAGNEGLIKSYFEKRTESHEAGAFINCYFEETTYRIKGSTPLQLHFYHYGTEPGVPIDTLTIDLAALPYTTDLADTFAINADTLYLDLYRDRTTYPPDDVWCVTLRSRRPLSVFRPLAMTLEGDNHAEVFGQALAHADFRTNDIDPRWQAGEAGHNMLAPGSFPSVIAVGASTYRMGGTTLNGSRYNVHAGSEQGRISPYSSTGPTFDGRIKPDVVAPGTNIFSSFSQFCPTPNTVIHESAFQGTVYPWGVATGTSMSAPMVAGVIALWLQARPTLTTEEILQVFHRTCQHPDPGLSYPNNIYGFGEIDAYRGLLDILGIDRIEGLSLYQPAALHIYPSGSGLRLVTDTPVSETIHLKLFNLSGACIFQTSLRLNGTETYLPLPPHPAAIYAVQTNAPTPSLRGSQLIRLER